MTLTRRTFLRKGAMTVFLTGLALDSIPLILAQKGIKHDPRLDFPVSPEAQQEPVFSFTSATFQPYLNDPITLRAGANSVGATLVKIRDWAPNPKLAKLTARARNSDSFVLIFEADGQLTDLTSVYDVQHQTLGTFPLFLSRRDGPQGKYFYEAVFNHAL
jgi:hypothetical protein